MAKKPVLSDPFYQPCIDAFSDYYKVWTKAKTGSEEKFIWNAKECGQLKNIINALKRAVASKGNLAALSTPGTFIEQVLKPFLQKYIEISLLQIYYFQTFTPSYIYSKINDIIIKIKSYVLTGQINGINIKSAKAIGLNQQREQDRDFRESYNWGSSNI